VTKGYLMVATLSKPFYDAAIMAAESLIDEVPDAKICFFTHKDWLEDRHKYLFDKIVTPVPVHCRTKLWALNQTPYDKTIYLDVDVFVLSNEIEEVFDHLGNHDVVMSENRPYNAKVVYFSHDEQEGPGMPGRELEHHKPEHIQLYKEGKAHKFRWHCGMFAWTKNERTQELWHHWLKWYKKHTVEKDTSPFPNGLAYWDTFAFWRALYEQPELAEKLDLVRLPNDAKYNFITGYRETELRPGHEKAVLHYTIDPAEVKKGHTYEADIDTEYGSFTDLK
jgi:hypothetical protein